MKNMMKEYLGEEYSDNHLRNFCLYWTKGIMCKNKYTSIDEWRKENDLDCLYLDGDLRADTLMSAWTPIKWVADCLNKDAEIAFYKTSRISEDPCHDLKLLAEESELYLAPDHRLVRRLTRFLELAEQRCNFILLPSRGMNSARYKNCIRGKVVWLCDEVPATLAHLYDKDSLGMYFLGEEGKVSDDLVDRWIRREHLEVCFEDGLINRRFIRPLISGLNPYESKWLTEEGEIYEALGYMVDVLRARLDLFIELKETA